MFRPKKSLIWERPMSTAIPLVKPITIETGINRMKLPILKSPIRNRNMPEKKVAMSRLPTPY